MLLVAGTISTRVMFVQTEDPSSTPYAPFAAITVWAAVFFLGALVATFSVLLTHLLVFRPRRRGALLLWTVVVGLISIPAMVICANVAADWMS